MVNATIEVITPTADAPNSMESAPITPPAIEKVITKKTTKFDAEKANQVKKSIPKKDIPEEVKSTEDTSNKTEVKATEVKATEKKAEVKIDEKELEIDKTSKKEEVKTEKKVEETEDKDEVARFAALAKERKFLDAEKAKMKTERAEMKAEVEKAQAVLNEVNHIKTGGPGEVLATIEKVFGVKFEDLAQYIINQEKPEYKAKLEIDKFKKETEEKSKSEKKAAEEKETERQKQFLASYQKNIDNHISGNIDEYPLIEYNNANHEVLIYIDEVFKKTGKETPISEASKIIESYLQQQHDERHNKLEAKRNKNKPVDEANKVNQADKKEELRAKDTDTTDSTTFKKPLFKSKVKTLTNNNATAISTPDEKPAETSQERHARAIAAIKNRPRA